MKPMIKGHVVTATGSSKKIAKNLAAKMMLDKLEEVCIGSFDFDPFLFHPFICVLDHFILTHFHLDLSSVY